MRSRNWSKKDVRYLRNNYMLLSQKDLSVLLDRPIAGIVRKLNRLGISTEGVWSNRKAKPAKTKACNICKTPLELIPENFYVRSANHDGFMDTCKACFKAKYFAPKEKKVLKVAVVKNVPERKPKPVYHSASARKVLKNLPGKKVKSEVSSFAQDLPIINTISNIFQQILTSVVTKITAEVTKNVLEKTQKVT